MPELPEVEFVRRRLERVLRGARIKRVLLRRQTLRRPFPPGFAARLEGRRMRAVERRGKYLLVPLDSPDLLLMHLGMSGSFRIERPSQTRAAARSAGDPPVDRHDHVVFELSNGAVVTFNDPRRFGVMDLVESTVDSRQASVDSRQSSVKSRRSSCNQALASLGVEPLDDAFDAAALARACAGKRTPLKSVLLDQRTVAGLGNIYASEALHLAGLSPLRRASTIATAAGRPRPPAGRLAGAIKTVLREAIARQERPYREGRFRVYDREGEPCPTRGCRGTIRRIVQAGRSTFYCPICQR